MRSDPENLTYVVVVNDGFADSLELDGYRQARIQTQEPIPDGWYVVTVPEEKPYATDYPELDDDAVFEAIDDPNMTLPWTHHG